MRALVITGPSDATDTSQVGELADPEPGPGEVTIDVEYAGINFVDVMMRRGDQPYADSFPAYPGDEVAGTVRAVGEGVTGLAAGTRVTAFLTAGGLASIARARAELTVPVPDGVPAPLAAATPAVLATGYLLLTQAARFRAGDRVLVHSASGGVGSAVAQLVPVLGGGQLIGTVGRASKVPTAIDAGYAAAFARDANYPDRVRAAAGGGVDVVLDALGAGELDNDLALAAPGGRIVLFGNATGGAPATLPHMGRLMGGNLSVGGFSISNLSRAAPARVADAMARCLDLLASGRVGLAVTEVDGLAAVPAVHQLLAEGRGRGKYVVRI
ncbi:NADPH:quinone reductase [Actinocatenispora thailandica]|uniref:NADPH:quinone reductase n=1 Tax=Actinocatenispora thailandica TaxID=227318 RepID=A0A7R7DT45_9ACTN|nr:zinc-binding dehydrogenase [Actinocatenispora thailandica]BCJ37332.1 NADPH:quinone reductase [Actinocatenispora thailandica]